MITIERFNEIVEEELALLPEYVFEELNGGVIVDEKVNLHPDRVADDLYIMGTYSTSPVMGKQIVIYYGSFAKTMPYADEDALRLKIRDTIRHEFRHHMETRAGFFGKGTLIDEDKQEMDRYYLMHAKWEETQSTSDQFVPDAGVSGANTGEGSAPQSSGAAEPSQESGDERDSRRPYEFSEAASRADSGAANNGSPSKGAASAYEINSGASVYLPGRDMSDDSKGQKDVMPAGYAGVKYVCQK